MKLLILFILVLFSTSVYAEEISVQIVEATEANGAIRYDIKSGDFTYHFWSINQIETFANSVDPSDNEQTILIKSILKSQLGNIPIETLVDSLKEKIVTYEVTKKEVTVEEKI